ncbi:MAG: FAD-dependent thymidylate synthase [bacterium]
MSILTGKTKITFKPSEIPVMDVMQGASRWETKVHKHGLVALVDVMPRLVPEGKTADSAIVQAARVSYGEGTNKITEDRSLIRYLLRHQHTSPFEMVEFKFHHVMPIFVARQWIRHRTASLNEYSARYSIVKDRFYRPVMSSLRQQSKTNKQGGTEPLDDLTAAEFSQYLDATETHFKDYQQLLDKGVARELARIGLPQNLYTEWYWKIDLHNLLHFLKLRMDVHAQLEIREYAKVMFDMIKPIVPMTIEAFEDYQLGAVTLTRLEVEAMRSGAPLVSDNKREQAEWEEKRRTLGLKAE